VSWKPHKQWLCMYLLQKCLKWWNPAKLYKKKAPKKGREKSNKGQGPKVQASKRGWPQGGKGTTKKQTLKSVDKLIDMFQLFEMKCCAHHTIKDVWNEDNVGPSWVSTLYPSGLAFSHLPSKFMICDWKRTKKKRHGLHGLYCSSKNLCIPIIHIL
jgi:hypothetical protein